ncbi:hypothetical protein QAD02_024375 [Eretmocerus hayati]|uniref:Uncharacterized protein n=1 Tax=Eretmocerus hayati TaxID=131215 RepID=A0ACC2PYT8_9HYME|nr:hypothetical protein QAD02_024375 [Eretmocerus hayati]
MAGLNAADTIEEQPDQLYSATELECLDKNSPSDLLVVKVSEVIYRQCQKEKEQQKVKDVAKAWTVIISCIFFVMVIALVVSKSLQDGNAREYEHNFIIHLRFGNQFFEISETPSLQLTTNGNESIYD